MDSPDVVRIADLDLFADCTKAQLRQIASLMTYLRVPRNRVLMREGARRRNSSSSAVVPPASTGDRAGRGQSGGRRTR